MVLFLILTNKNSGYAQDKKIGIITSEFLFNGENFSEGRKLQQSLEFAISNTNLLRVVDRNKLGTLNDKIQTEVNLKKDLSSTFNDSLK